MDRDRNKYVKGPTRSATVGDTTSSYPQRARLTISSTRSCHRTSRGYKHRGLEEPSFSNRIADEVCWHLVFLRLWFPKVLLCITKSVPAVSSLLLAGLWGFTFRPMYFNSRLFLSDMRSGPCPYSHVIRTASAFALYVACVFHSYLKSLTDHEYLLSGYGKA